MKKISALEPGTDSYEAFERLIADDRRRFELKLFVAGLTQRSTEAIAAVRAICEEHLQGRYELTVVDLYKHPELAQAAEIVAVPTLVRSLPLPLRRLIGNLSDRERLVVGLDIRIGVKPGEAGE